MYGKLAPAALALTAEHPVPAGDCGCPVGVRTDAVASRSARAAPLRVALARRKAKSPRHNAWGSRLWAGGGKRCLQRRGGGMVGTARPVKGTRPFPLRQTIPPNGG